MRTIERSGRRLLELINDILDVAKIGASELKLEIGPVAVESVCEASLGLVKQAAHKKRLQVTLTLELANFIGHLRLPPDDPWCPECPVPWAEVKLRTVSGNFEDCTSTDENGRFSFSGLGPGVYVARVFVPSEFEFE